MTGYGKRPGHKRRMPTVEETNAALIKRLRVLAMRNARDQARDEARDDAGDEAQVEAGDGPE